MVKAKTRPLNLLIPEDLSEWFTEYSKSIGKTKTEITCTFLQSLKNGEAYSDVENHVGNDVDSIESVVKAYLDKHLQDYVDKYLHSAKQTDKDNYVGNDVDSYVEANVENPVDDSVDTDVENPVDDSESLPIIEAIENIAAPSIENPSNDETLSNEIAATAKPSYTLKQMNMTNALAKMKEIGLSGDPKSGKDFALMYPDHFEYDPKNKKISWKKPKP